MFGSKLRSWMEAVRSRKKQHRKEKQSKCIEEANGKNSENSDNQIKGLLEFRKKNDQNGHKGHLCAHEGRPGTSEINECREHSRYSTQNLSSPESAYSTGYSTDGNSPGAPPESLLNTSKPTSILNPQRSVLKDIQSPKYSKLRPIEKLTKLAPPNRTSTSSNNITLTSILKVKEVEEPRIVPIVENVVTPSSPIVGMMSPRQRNRIRTNPWFSNSTLSLSPVKQTTIPSKLFRESPKMKKIRSPSVNRRKSLSSSSCSSFGGISVQLDVPRPLSISDEDFTLNEMMGKYDESYIYEKETDILSDSDPTDCDTDIDTGQDGGDEDDAFEGDLDFIDNGSFNEFDTKTDLNTGHCSYYNYELQKKRSSRRCTTRRSRRISERSDRKKRSSLNKKRFPILVEHDKKNIGWCDGSKSAGATPLSVRRAHSKPVSKLALEETLRKRSNSIGFYHDDISTIDKRDKEADLKYRELITEADQLLRTMKTNGLSPRRMPGPSNKRVELLRTTECAKAEIFVKNRVQLQEDNMANNSFTKIPSSAMHNCPRFSPKKNHITKFIISNSPILVKKEWEMQNNPYKSPVAHRKNPENYYPKEKNPFYKDNNSLSNRKISPILRQKNTKLRTVVSSSESEEESLQKASNGKICPQSEPVRRKVYFRHNNSQKFSNRRKTVAFDIERNFKNYEPIAKSTENLRQQILMSTLASLKRNLEDHSYSLKQVYNSSHNLYV